jgi:hypothetical protein
LPELVTLTLALPFLGLGIIEVGTLVYYE